MVDLLVIDELIQSWMPMNRWIVDCSNNVCTWDDIFYYCNSMFEFRNPS